MGTAKANIIALIEEEISLNICERDVLKKWPELKWTTKIEAKMELKYMNELIEFKLNYIKKLKPRTIKNE